MLFAIVDTFLFFPRRWTSPRNGALSWVGYLRYLNRKNYLR